MSLYSTLYQSYANRQIGPADVKAAVKNNFITEQEASTILEIQVKYSLDLARQYKKKELSTDCQAAIGLGVDVPLSDGTVKHFSLTDHDQTNLTAKMMNILAGGTSFEYHSDGEPCVYYSAEDMGTICVAAQQKVSYETTYYNCLCQWMNGLTDPDEVMAIQYGMDIPKEYWSEPWKNYMEQLAAISEQSTTEGANVSEQVPDQGEMETGPATSDTEAPDTSKKIRKKKA